MRATRRWARAVVALIGITAVLAGLVVMTNRLADRRPPGLGAVPVNMAPVEIDQKALPDSFRTFAPFYGPMPLGTDVTLVGDIGIMARLQVTRGNDADGPSYTVRVQNIGSKPFNGPFSTGAWLDTENGKTFHLTRVQPLSTGSLTPSTLVAATEADLALVFNLVGQARPARLRLGLQLGHYYPTAEWTLTP